MDTDELLATWSTYEQRSTWAAVMRIRTTEHGDTAIAQRTLDALPEVSALDALAANRQLVELLTGRRWYVMREAREAGASWSEIGAALGMSKQGAQDWYRRKIAEREEHVPDFHDAERSQAVLDITAVPAAITPPYDEYYRSTAPAYTSAQLGDFVLVMTDAFRGPDGEYACANVVGLDEQGSNRVEVDQPQHLGSGGHAWIALTDLALVAGTDAHAAGA